MTLKDRLTHPFIPSSSSTSTRSDINTFNLTLSSTHPPISCLTDQYIKSSLLPVSFRVPRRINLTGSLIRCQDLCWLLAVSVPGVWSQPETLVIKASPQTPDISLYIGSDIYQKSDVNSEQQSISDLSSPLDRVTDLFYHISRLPNSLPRSRFILCYNAELGILSRTQSTWLGTVSR